MQAIIFPVTYISEKTLAAVRSCFQNVIVYQPTRRQVPSRMQAWAQKGLIDIRIPVSLDENKLETVLKDYKNWVSLHPGGMLEFLNASKDTTPFFDETSSSQIIAEVKNTGPQKKPDPLFNTRLFLQIAQEYDIQSDEIIQELASSDRSEQDLMNHLIGEEADSIREIRGLGTRYHRDSAEYMLFERVLAWARLFQQDREDDSREMPRLFITNSPAALEFLINQAPATEMVTQIKSIPILPDSSKELESWHNRLSSALSRLAENTGLQSNDAGLRLPVTAESEPKVTFTLYRVPEESPAAFFARCVDRKITPGFLDNKSKDLNHTLLGLIKID
ncbi:hypothetical protein ACFL0M_08455 [Thermodesulfobacteriota bacterium]